MTSTTINISIITVGYCSQHTLPDCLKSIAKQKNCSVEVIYVENASHHPADATVKSFAPQAVIVNSGQNLGFSKGCNAGAKKAQGEYLLFLNPDSELQTESTLATLYTFMKNHSDVGVCAPVIYDANGEKAHSIRYNYFGQQYVDPPATNLPGDIAWVCGAALMISRELFDKIGGFDERYFMYSDDEDICLEARKLGFKCAEVANTKLMHIGGQSSKRWNVSERHFREELARTQFTEKHYSAKNHKKIWRKRRLRFRRALVTSTLLAPRKVSHYLGKLRAINESQSLINLDKKSHDLS